jgi:para-aminobenzoate synthetase component 1
LNTHSRRWDSVGRETFLGICRALADSHRADLFISGLGYPGQNSNYVGLEPNDELVITAAASRQQLKDFAYRDSRPTFGFLSYEFTEKTPDVPILETGRFPLAHFKKYTAVISYDDSDQTIEIQTDRTDLADSIEQLLHSHDPPSIPDADTSPLIGPAMPSLDRRAYEDAVSRVLEYIRQGDVYQLCLSIMFTARLAGESTADFFLYLLREHPAPFYTWFNSGALQLLSTSPECFLRVRDGAVMSQPIKGTVQFDRYDDSQVSQLVSSPKEDAELSMIVDLIRNDISMNCRYGSVRVENHKSVFRVGNLLQMYSTVRGELKPGRCCVDLLFDAFPGGSVTGCPKKRAMELISELEPHRRDIFCGSFVILHGPQDMDSAVAIRTGYADTEVREFRFFAGSGIVVSSVPHKEYEETIAKAARFIQHCR